MKKFRWQVVTRSGFVHSGTIESLNLIEATIEIQDLMGSDVVKVIVEEDEKKTPSK